MKQFESHVARRNVILVKIIKIHSKSTRMASHQFNLEKLKGRDNFASWKFSVRTYLEHEDLWECVQPPSEDDKIDLKKDVKAKAKLILLIEPQNYVHVQDCKTAREVWYNLQRAFDDKGLTRKVGLLKDLVNTTLESSSSVEDYINKIMTTAHKLRSIEFDINEEWLGTLMLAGLPDVYAPMIMGLESSGIQINADFIKTKLLQEIKPADSGAALYINYKKLKGVRCYNCNRYGHYAKFCKIQRNTADKQDEKGDSTNFVAAFSATLEGLNNKWLVDSGASMHMTGRRDWMYNVTKPPVNAITVANKEPLSVDSIGCVNLKLARGNIQVKDVLYVPGLAANLLSVSSIVKSGYTITFNNKSCYVYDKNRKLICSAALSNKLYVLNTVSDTEAANLSTSVDNKYLWHLRMAHLNISDLNKLSSCAEGVTLTGGEENDITCIQCSEGKQSRLPFSNLGTRATQPLELIHSDLCGPMENKSCSGMRYFISFVDDYTRMVHVYLMKDKLNVLEIFKDFKAKVEVKLEKKIKTLRTDNGKEYCNHHFENYLSSQGITHQTSTPYTPQHNGLAERMNRTLVERARCMLFHANLGKKYWAEAIATASYITNRCPTKTLKGKTPFEMWNGYKPNLSHIRIFGTEAMVHIPKEKRQKWDKKSKKMILIGYCDNTKGYRLLDINSDKIVISRDVIFHEKFENNLSCKNNVPVPELPCSDSSPTKEEEEEDRHASFVQNSSDQPISESESSTATGNNDDSQDEDSIEEYHSGTDDLDETYQPPRQACKSQNYVRNMTLRPRSKVEKQSSENNLCCLYTNLSDPQSVQEALSSPQAEHWRKAMDQEYYSLMKNNTWSLVDLPTNKRALPSKWVFKTKTNEAGQVVRFKARLVIKGFAQRKGIDYEEIYSPVVRYATIRLLVSLAAKHNMDIEQMDAVSAFLQGEIDADIYMAQPEMYMQGSKVCHLHKSIYGLKQASRLWNTKLNNVLQSIGMLQCKTDPCVYYNAEKNTFIAVWVDDLLIFTSQQSIKEMLKNKLMHHFEMKDLGKASQCLGFNITRAENLIALDQRKYISEVLDKYKMSECNAVKTPIEVAQKFNNDVKAEVRTDYPYRQIIGCLLYIAQGTRPDIAFAVNTLSRYNNEPKTEHVMAVKRLLRYLQGTKDLKLIYTKDGNASITGYCDADWASDVHDRKSCTGYIFLLQGGAVSWSSRKQQTVALSTAEAEYMAMSAAAQEALWLRQLGGELGCQLSEPLVIFSDSQSAIKLSLNDCYLPRTKHIDIRHHFLKQHVINCDINFCYCKGNEMIADILTKGTTLEKHQYCLTKMGLAFWGGC